MKSLPAILALSFAILLPVSEAGPRNQFAGRYDGKWGPLKARDAATGEIFLQVKRKARVTLKIPRGAGRRNGAIDISGEFFGEPAGIPVNARLLSDFAAPKIRRRGRLAIYRADVELKIRTELPLSPDNIQGTMVLRVLNRGSKTVIKRGNIQLFFPAIGIYPDPAKLTGQVRGRK